MHKKHRENVQVRKNAFVDSGDGVIAFPEGQVISDASVQRNGTRYDITTMDVSEYEGQVTADHFDTVDSIVGQALNWAKNGDQLTIGGIRFAVNESALARLHYDLMRGGFPVDLSIETYGPYPDQEGVYYNSKLIGLSTCVVGNNKSATINKKERELVLNSLAKAKEDGLDTSEAEKLFKVEEAAALTAPPAIPAVTNKDKQVMFKTIKNGRDFAVKLTYKNAAGEEVTTDLAPGGQIDVSEDQVEALNKAIADATNAVAEKASFLNDVKDAIAAAVEPLKTELNELKTREEQAFNAGAKEPEFKKAGNGAVRNDGQFAANELNAMDWRERHGAQIMLGWNALKQGDPEAFAELKKINVFHLAKLKEKGIVPNSVSITDFGNFVISPELISEIQGVRSDYSQLINATSWKETLSTQMAWLSRSGDIDMQPVEFLDDGVTSQFANGNLKPLSTYSATIQTANLEELAAVTPVCNAATRFLAADLLGDVAKGYRNDYDRKRAQLVIARLEQAIQAHTGNAVPYDGVSTAVNGVIDFLRVWTKIGEKTPNGTYVLGTSSFAELQTKALSAGTNGPLANIFTSGRDGVPNIFGRPYIVVSDDLLPRLNTAETKSFVVNGTTVTVSHAVFYFDLSNFTGRTSGGLQYDLSTEAAYEDSGTVKSAYQRNELVLRGSFFRGGAILDDNQVSALSAVGVS